MWTMACELRFDGALLAQAIEATFKRRKTTIPAEEPTGLTREFAEDGGKVAQWEAFITGHSLKTGDIGLRSIIETLQTFLVPPLLAAANGQEYPQSWPPGGPWQ